MAFGFRRLAILDLSPRGHQPMPNHTGERWTMLNGEIYNYLELREELRGVGYAFRTETDTEVVLAAYDAWGEACVTRFNGMFAIALWDGPAGRLFCARDRFGVKPLYYLHDAGIFAFASEIKALLPYLDERRADLAYLRRFLDTGLSDDGTDTFVEGVKAVLPAHTMTVTPERLVERRYWDLDVAATARARGAGSEEALRELLIDSVRLRLRSDVPVGTCASGGIDSSAIVSIASRLLSHPMHSFSAVYPVPGYDEGRFVDCITSSAGTLATRVTPSPDRWFDVIGRMTWHQDGPTAAGGLYTQWHVMEAAHGKVTVLLDGQGGDELFAGYFRHLPVLAAQLWGRVRHGQLTATWPALRETAFLGIRWREHFEEWTLGQFARAVLQRSRSRRTGNGMAPLYRGLLAETVPQAPALGRVPAGLDSLNAALYRDVTAASVPMLLRFEDRNSMAFNIEARVPFLDYRLVEFALTVPGERKVERGLSKAYLRRALAGIVPPPILDRKDKKGYATPLAVWLRGPLRAQAWAFLQDRVLPRGWYDPAAVSRRWTQHQRGRHDWSAEIARWMTAEIWWRQVIEGEGA
jgi:asparagine synthase (glutamine-hydrolysing)